MSQYKWNIWRKEGRKAKQYKGKEEVKLYEEERRKPILKEIMMKTSVYLQHSALSSQISGHETNKYGKAEKQ